MLRKYTPIIATLITTIIWLASCSEDLRRITPLQAQQNPDSTSSLNFLLNKNPLEDTVAIMYALTPLSGKHADTLLNSKMVKVKSITDYSKGLPFDADVLYINTNYDCSQIPESKIFNEALSRYYTRILIDGSPQSVEKFAKENFGIFEVGAELIAYYNVPANSEENTTDSLNANEIKSIGSDGFGVLAFGAKKNEISTTSFLSALFKTHVPISIKKDTTEYTLPDINDNSSIQSQNDLSRTRPAGNLPFCDQNKIIWTDHEKPYYMMGRSGLYDDYNQSYKVKATEPHFENPSNDFANWGFTVISEYYNWPYYGAYHKFPVKRISCGDNNGTSMWIKRTWNSDIKKPKITQWKYFTSTPLTRIDIPKVKSAYLDISFSKTVSKTKGKAWTVGGSVSVWAKVSIAKVTVEANYEYSKKKTQTTTVQANTQREFWVSPCLAKIAGGQTIFGRAVVYQGEVTPYSYIHGDVSMPYWFEYGYTWMERKDGYSIIDQARYARSLVYRMSDPKSGNYLINMNNNIRVDKQQTLFWGPTTIASFWHRSSQTNAPQIPWRDLRKCLRDCGGNCK